jgi:Tfp pilus assembly protein PilN
VAGCTVIAVVALGAFFKIDSVRMEFAIQGEQDKLETVERALTQQQPLQDDIAMVNSRKSSIEALRANTTTYDNILTLVEQATPSKMQIKKLTHKTGEKLVMSGVAGQQSDINAFIATLKASPVFSQVLLQQTASADNGISFEVEALVNQGVAQ